MLATNNPWLKQSEHDFKVAQMANRENYHDWAVFCASQAVEKVVKANILQLTPGLHKKDYKKAFNTHSNRVLLDFLPDRFISEQIKDDCLLIDSAFNYTRYPTQDQSKPEQEFTKKKWYSPFEVCKKEDCEEVIKAAEKLTKYFRGTYDVLTQNLDSIALPQY